MDDPLVEMMRGTAARDEKADAILEGEAAELSELAICLIPFIIKLPEHQQNAILFFAYKWAESKLSAGIKN